MLLHHSPSTRAFLAAVAGGLLGLAGCQTEPEPRPSLQVTSSQVRASRRAYAGAPPVIPHAPLGGSCTSCHTPQGKEAPPLGIAPANPHGADGRGTAVANCRQCHVFAQAAPEFAASNFQGTRQLQAKAERLFAGAPPVIPHPVILRENCTGCHSGPAARPEIRCTHPERTNCRQCHVAGDEPLPGGLATSE